MFRSTIGYESNLDGVERTEIANGWGEGGGGGAAYRVYRNFNPFRTFQ